MGMIKEIGSIIIIFFFWIYVNLEVLGVTIYTIKKFVVLVDQSLFGLELSSLIHHPINHNLRVCRSFQYYQAASITITTIYLPSTFCKSIEVYTLGLSFEGGGVCKLSSRLEP